MDYQNCWANYRCDCARKMSSEHLISKNLFPDNKIRVKGFDWCKEEKLIGINAMTRKVLCEHHNNALSPTDSEAKFAINSFTQGVTDKPINGYLFERWLLKTGINFSIGSQFHIGMGFTDSEIGKPSPYAIDVAFGDLNFSHKMGLYVFETEQNIANNPNSIILTPITLEQTIGGYYFYLRGVNIFLNLVPAHEPPTPEWFDNIGLPFKLADKPPFYRPASISTIRISDKSLQKIEFEW